MGGARAAIALAQKADRAKSNGHAEPRCVPPAQRVEHRFDRAVTAARASFEKKSWRGLDPSKKEKILWDIADLLVKHKDGDGFRHRWPFVPSAEQVFTSTGEE